MNMQAMLQQARRMQKDIETKKSEIEKETFEGTYEFVTVTLNGKKEMVKCKINKESLAKEDIEMLEDFILLAVKDALSKVDKEYNAKMGQYASALNGLI